MDKMFFNGLTPSSSASHSHSPQMLNNVAHSPTAAAASPSPSTYSSLSANTPSLRLHTYRRTRRALSIVHWTINDSAARPSIRFLRLHSSGADAEAETQCSSSASVGRPLTVEGDRPF